MNDADIWKNSYDELESLKAMLQQGISDWQRLQREVGELVARADQDPVAAKTVADIELYFRRRIESGPDLQERVEALKESMKTMRLRIEQERKTQRRELGSASADENRRAAKKRVKRFA